MLSQSELWRRNPNRRIDINWLHRPPLQLPIREERRHDEPKQAANGTEIQQGALSDRKRSLEGRETESKLFVAKEGGISSEWQRK